jgi:hypothetical protein
VIEQSKGKFLHAASTPREVGSSYDHERRHCDEIDAVRHARASVSSGWGTSWQLTWRKAELKYGHNERLRWLAQEIVVNQQQEIAVMRLALGDKPLPSIAAAVSARVATTSRGGMMSSSMGPHDTMSHNSMGMR